RVKKMRRASLKGWKYALENPAEIIKLIISNYNTQNLTESHLKFEAEQTAKLINAKFIEIGHVEPSRYQKIAGIYTQLSIADRFTVDGSFYFNEDGKKNERQRSDKVKEISFTKEEKQWIDKHVVKVGVEEWAPIVFSKKDGGVGGVAGAYLDILAARTGLKFEVVSDEWNTLLSGLRKKTIDLLPATYYTDERATYGLYSKPYFTSREFIYVKDGSPFTSIDDLGEKSIAVVKGYGTIPKLREKYPKAKIVETKDLMTSINAVLNGEVDGLMEAQIAVELLLRENAIIGLRGISQIVFPASPIHLFSRIDEPLLNSILQKGLDNITAKEKLQIHGRWLTVAGGLDEQKVELTAEEKAWIANNPQILVHNEMDWPPFNYNKGGQPLGYSIDYMNLVAKKLGIKVEYISGPTWGQFLEKIQHDELDVLLNIVNTDERRKYLLFTDSYIKAKAAIVTLKERMDLKKLSHLENRTVAIPKGFFFEEMLKNHYPKIKLKLVDNAQQGLQAVSMGEVDATIGEDVVLLYLINESFMTNLKLAGFIEDDRFTSIMNIAVAKDKTTLRNLLQKGMNAITPSEKHNLINRWLSLDAVAESKRINLTSKERDWLDKHPTVRLGTDPAWPPFDFVNNKGKHVGLSADVLKRLEEKLGIKFKFQPNLTWSDVVAKSKRREIDVISLASETSERREFLKWSQSIVTTPLVVAAKNDFKEVNSVADVKGQRILVAKGYAVVSHLRKNHPEIKFSEVPTPLEALKQISSGKADVYIGYLGSINYLIKDHGLFNLRVVGPTGFPAKKLSIAIRSDWPELVSLINKGLASISHDEMSLIQKKWLPTLEFKPQTGKTDDQDTWWLMVIAIIIFLIMLVGALLLPRLFSDDVLMRHFGSVRFRIMALIIMSIMVLLVGLLVWYTLGQNKKVTLSNLSTELKVVLQNTMERNDFWVHGRLNLLSQLGRDPELVAITKRLLKVEPSSDALKQSHPLAEARQFVAQRKAEFGEIGFFIISPEHISIGSRRDANLGTINLIAQQKPELLKQVFAGKAIFIPPIQSDVDIKSGRDKKVGATRKPLTMFFAVPIRDQNGVVIAVLTQRLDPYGRMSKIMHSGRIGHSGETYVIDHEGRQITSSRFRDQLYDIGLLDREGSSDETIVVRNPGVNLLKGFQSQIPQAQQPFTRMVEGLFSLARELKEQGSMVDHSDIEVDINGYLDYRGVPVFGAWLWEPHLGLGMTTEIDVEEALGGYYTLRLNLLIITGVTLLLTIIATLLSIMLGERATRVMRRTQEQLEERVEERTRALHESQERQELALEGGELGSWDVDIATGTTVVNDRYKTILGVPQNRGVLDRNTWIQHLHPEDRDRVLEFGQQYRNGLESRYEIEYRIIKPNGEERWVISKGAAMGKHMDGSTIRMVGTVQDITARKEVELEVEKLSTAVKESPVSVIITDVDGSIEFVNNKFVDTTGYTAREVLGKNPNILSSGETEVEIYEKMWSALLAGDHWDGVLLNRKKDGDFFWMRMSISPIMDDKGQVINFVSVGEDITQQKRLQEERDDAMHIISGSIQYASRIQRSILPPDAILEDTFAEYFVLWEPRDIVGGDMYWHRSWGAGSLVMLGDCTGHGVPGAFMTLISNGALDEAYLETPPGDPAALLKRMHQLIQSSLGQDQQITEDEGASDDGIEIGACFINHNDGTITFVGARFDLYILHEGEVKSIKGTKAGLGYRGTPQDINFTSHKIDISQQSSYYMTSDGLIDQIGGEKKRGFGKRRFMSLLTAYSDVPLTEQKELILKALVEYQGEQKRRDDLSVMGFKCREVTGHVSNKDMVEMDQSMLVGYKAIDDDHRRLFELVNRLNESIVRGHDNNSIMEILNQLVEYTGWHFRHEDRLMQTSDYPHYNQHKQAHNSLVDQVVKIQNDIKQNDADISSELMLFLLDWLNTHIHNEDKQLADYLNSLDEQSNSAELDSLGWPQELTNIGTGKEYFKLDENMLLGFAPMDDDHKKLVDLINLLHGAISEAKDKVTVLNILDQLVDYTTWHFRHEERLMQSNNYPEIEKHQIAHGALINQAKEMRRKLYNDDIESTLELIAPFKSWLLNHIPEVDSRLADFMNKL
ncbi:MAG: bacteriohemerythrin, partial [Magnetococcales bacterium]|nr:bacteriohemerythrin [Magnetococcales bacterium]